MTLAELETGWRLAPLRHVVQLNPETLAEGTAEDFEFSYIDIGSVTGGRIGETQEMVFSGAPSRARRVVRSGDVLVSTVRTYLRAVAGVPDSLDREVASTGFAVLRPDCSRIDPRFLRYWCLGEPFVSEVVSRSVGVSYPAINASEIVRLPVPLPPLAEQRRLADFLDSELELLDAAVSRHESLISLLKERLEAAREDACFGGHPADADGGWSSLPSGWDVRPVRSLSRMPLTDGDWVELPHITDEGIRLLQTGNVGVGTFREQGFRYISEDSFEELRCTEVLPGDLLICRLADPVGRACLAPDLGVRMITSVDVAICRPSEDVDARYYAHLMSTPRWLSRLANESRGGTRDRVSRSQLGALRVPVPPLGEQRDIADRLDAAQARTEKLRALLAEKISLIRERRQALITAAVTGQLQVGEAA